MTYLTVGKHKFAKSRAAIVNSLFDPGGTASGHYRRTRKVDGTVYFYGIDGQLFACRIANRHGERFFVSCRTQDDGRVRYSFGLADHDKAKLGLGGVGYLAEHDAAVAIG